MSYIIILKARKFYQSTRKRFGIAGKKPVAGGGAQCAPSPALIGLKFDLVLALHFSYQITKITALSCQIQFHMCVSVITVEWCQVK